MANQELKKMLDQLTGTQQNILQTSLWIMTRKSQYKESVETILQAIMKQHDSRKLLNLMNLVNDIIQNSKKKTDFIAKEFQEKLVEIIKHNKNNMQEKHLEKLKRILSIWKERQIYPIPLIMKLTKGLMTTTTVRIPTNQQQHNECRTPEGEPPIKITEMEEKIRAYYYKTKEEEDKKEKATSLIQAWMQKEKNELGEALVNMLYKEDTLRNTKKHVEEHAAHMVEFENIVGAPDMEILAKKAEDYAQAYKAYIETKETFAEQLELAIDEQTNEAEEAKEKEKIMNQTRRKIKNLQALKEAGQKRTHSEAFLATEVAKDEDDIPGGFGEPATKKKKTDTLDQMMQQIANKDDEDVSI